MFEVSVCVYELPALARLNSTTTTSTAKANSPSILNERFESIDERPLGEGPFPPDQPHVPPTTGGTACLNLARSTLLRFGSVPPVDVGGESTDKGQVTVPLGVVEPVSDHEVIAYVEAGVGDVDVPGPGRSGLAQQGATPDRGRPARLQVPDQPGQGEAGVDDVLDDQHVPAGNVGVEVLEDADHAPG